LSGGDTSNRRSSDEFVPNDPKTDPIGRFLTHWIGLTYINTIIYGIPVLNALYGPVTTLWCVLAAMSSLIMQLPLMLGMFETREQIKEQLGVGGAEPYMLDSHSDAKSNSKSGSADAPQIVTVGTHDDHHDDIELQPAHNTAVEQGSQPQQQQQRNAVHYTYTSPMFWLTVCVRAAQNPPFMGVVAGCLYSLIVVNGFDSRPNPESLPAAVAGSYPLSLENLFRVYLGATVTPVATLVIGLFMNGDFWKQVVAKIRSIMFYILMKSFIVPLMLVAILRIQNSMVTTEITGMKARSAVYIAALPIALASFTVTKRYNVSGVEMSACVVLGTILILPVSVMWKAIMDSWADNTDWGRDMFTV
jgi:predicted permease